VQTVLKSMNSVFLMSSCCKILDLTVLPNLYKEVDFLVSKSVELHQSREVSPEV